MIDSSRWHELSDLLDEALALPAEQRAPWLDRLRERDASLADLVAQALAEDDAAGDTSSAPRPGDSTLPGLLRFGQSPGAIVGC